MKWNTHIFLVPIALLLPFNLTGCIYAAYTGGIVYSSVYDSVTSKSKVIKYSDSMLLPSDGKLIFISQVSLMDTSTQGNEGLKLKYTSTASDKTINRDLTINIIDIPKADSHEFTFNLSTYNGYNLRSVIFKGKYVFGLQTFSGRRVWNYELACDKDNPYTGILSDYRSYQDLIVIPMLADKYSKYRMTCRGDTNVLPHDSIYLKKEGAVLDKV